ncbi:signal peptidase I [Arthrobacter sp. SA17]
MQPIHSKAPPPQPPSPSLAAWGASRYAKPVAASEQSAQPRAVLGTLCLLAALTGMLFGAKPLVFRSGSMSPAIATGALGISFPVDAQEIRTGDIISVENSAGVRITHRVVASELVNGSATVTLKGDANAVSDPEPYVLRTADRVAFSVPLLGYGVAWLSSPAAMFVGGLFTAFLLYLAFGSARTKHAERPEDPDDGPGSEPVTRVAATPRPDKAGRRSKRMAATLVASLALVATGALQTSVPSQAAFMDTASATAGFTAKTLQTPTMACTNSGSDVILTLTQPGDFGTLYELKSTMPMRTWKTGTWTQGAMVNVTIDADDPMVTSSQARNVNFTASNKFSAWTSALTSKVVRYTPALTVEGLGLLPPTLACV